MTSKEKELIFLNTISIDSLRLSFPLEKVKILDTSVLNKVVHYQTTRTDTGEVIEEEFKASNSQLIYFESEPTYSIKVRKEIWFGQERLSVLLNAKILEHEYLEGITINNIESIYNKLNGKVFSMTFEEFLLGSPSDIDFKKDIYCESTQDFDLFTNELEKNSAPTKKKNYGVNRFHKQTNKGIEWNERSKSTHAYPFLKLYHKGVEAKHGNNSEFFNKYIPSNQLETRSRVEVTIKSKKDCKKYGIDSSTLLTLLKTDKQVLSEAVNHAITKNLEPRKPLKKAKKVNELNNYDRLAYLHITNLMQNQKYTFLDALEWTISQYPEGVPRSRMKTKLTSVYEHNIKGEKYEVRTLKMDSFFNSFGWS